MTVITKFLAALACAGLVCLVGAGTAGARDKYPPNVRKAFVGPCLVGAEQRGLKAKQQRVYCRKVITCIEGKLTLEQFNEVARKTKRKIKDRRVRSCIAKARRQVG